MQAGCTESVCDVDGGHPGVTADLALIKLGSLTLDPEFDPDVTEYTATTENTSNTLTATPEDENAEVTVTLGDTEVDAGADGKYTLTWETGENVVAISVVNGEAIKEYTITVTKP